ncbi:MAG: TIGR00282 family metallophosphoesterase [Spirochaetales bacterium]|nr:TIGR00282 family metallophosphoesterase [Spirochaetales bacterium]
MSKDFTALFLGDVVGQPGCRALFIGLKDLIRKHKADLVIINGENAADGFGITPEIADSFFANGTHVITSGNHIWQKRDIYHHLESQNLLRPANYPSRAPGKGVAIVENKGVKAAVINLQGREELPSIDCPFQCSKDILKKLPGDVKIKIIDFHAERPTEKEALALFLDGKVSALLGTHTHVPTSDERVLPGGTAFITDVGMTGPQDSVIGAEPGQAIHRSLTQMPLKMEISENGGIINGVVINIDPATGRALKIKRVKTILGV